MLRALIELSRYLFVINLGIYTLISYIVLHKVDEQRKTASFLVQDIIIFVNHMIGSLVLMSTRQDLTYAFYPIIQMIAIFSFLVLMRAIYPYSNRLISTHIALLLSIGFLVLTRLSLQRSIRQFAIAAVSLVVALIVPAVIKHIRFIYKMKWLYALVGIGILAAVLLSGSITNGSKLSFSIMGVSFQPSEFVKIIYILFLAAMLEREAKFRTVFVTAVLAGIHVLILAASKDFGSALIYFSVFVILVYIATAKKRYLFAGIAGTAVASVIAYYLFSHIRVRVAVWLNPWLDIENKGYQVAQSLFAIGTGGWFGMGIDSGTPSSIPYVEQDFIFSAICEEFGALFGILLIAVCVNLFLEIVHVARECEERFLKLSAYGIASLYIVQLFLTIGGNSKFIPLTGVTLPLVSYGGSSVLATLIMLSLIQGLYLNYNAVLHEEELPPSRNLQMNVISSFFCLLFLAMAGYLAHYVYFDSSEVISNSYNAKRQEIIAEQTIRGNIVARDETVLATTITSADGQRRYYPYGEVFSHAIGYESNGRMGVEQSANMDLVSSNIPLNDKLQDDLADEKHMGNTVYTTFDVKLQQAAYDALGIYQGAVLITEPSTGKILAMVSKPDFDPNEITSIWDELIEDEDSSVLVNRATQGLYPPGSTFKIVTALEYIRENPTTYSSYRYTCNGRFLSGDSSIRCYHGTNHGEIDFTTSFAKSCNSSFANIGVSLNRSLFAETLNSLFFNQKLPVDFVTSNSRVTLEEETADSSVIQTVIGQGDTQMTPLHLAMITAAIANQGEMMKPYAIDHVETAKGVTIKSYEPTSLGQVMTAEEAAVLQELMVAVVEEGTGTRLSGQGYLAAGKTGSAEYNNSKSDSHAWFTGFTYQTENPLQITVIMEEAGSGGEYAVPVAKRILDQYYQ